LCLPTAIAQTHHSLAPTHIPYNLFHSRRAQTYKLTKFTKPSIATPPHPPWPPAASASSPAPQSHAPFTTSPFLRIKEDADRTPEQVEAAKQDQLREQKEGKGRWREDLASHGESNIAADKQNVEDHGEHMEELQKEGKEKGEKGEL
jgi:hypothetical protein